MGRIYRKGFKSGMKESLGNGKLIIISMTVSGINDHGQTVSTVQFSLARAMNKPLCMRDG